MYFQKNMENAARAVYQNQSLDFQLGIFEEGANKVMIRSRDIYSENRVELTPSDHSELWFLSQKLGVDPSMRKLAFESLPKSAIGISFVNHAEGILCIFQKNIGGYTGGDGVIHVVEYYFTIPKNRNWTLDAVEYFPLYAVDDYRPAMLPIFKASVEFYETFYNSCVQFYEKSDEKFEELFQKAKGLFGKVVDMRLEIQEKINGGMLQGAMYFERPTFRLQAIMEAVVRDMQAVETLTLPFKN
jgi:hypothetical protein